MLRNGPPKPKKHPKKQHEALTQAAECLKALAHPHRLRIVQLLLTGEPYTVNELAEVVRNRATCGLRSFAAYAALWVSEQQQRRTHRLLHRLRTPFGSYYGLHRRKILGLKFFPNIHLNIPMFICYAWLHWHVTCKLGWVETASAIWSPDMLLKYFYDPTLAHASYLIGCQRTGEAIVIDPGRDTRQYIEAAAREGMRIVGAADTHIHADYVSGARQLAEECDARLYVSDEGPAEWKYEFASQYDHQLLKDGDTFFAGKVEFRVLHTPGHTPESISFVLTDRGGGADAPMGIFTGDFVFVGSIGRPDLLEEAAGISGTAEPGARDLYRSMAKFRELPDFLQVWPAHGAGSACGKGLGAIPSSTVGYERRFNPAFQFDSEDAFVDYILSEQPEAPKYFAIMKRVNKLGPAILPQNILPAQLPSDQLESTTAKHIGDRHPSIARICLRPRSWLNQHSC